MSRQVRSLRTPPQSHAVKAPILISVVLCVCGLFLLHRTGLETAVPVAAAPAAAVPHSAPQMAPQRVVPAPRPPEHPALPKPRVAPPAAPQRTIPRHLGVPTIQANPEGWIDHVPSVTQEQVARALIDYGSPLAGAWPRKGGYSYAEYIWHAGKALGVDPALFMGMFKHESDFGLSGMARFTHSPGNIRCYKDPLPGSYCYPGDYEAYADWWYGIDATYTLLRRYAHHGARTVAEAIPVWAPASDSNDDSAYISSVLATMEQLTSL